MNYLTSRVRGEIDPNLLAAEIRDHLGLEERVLIAFHPDDYDDDPGHIVVSVDIPAEDLDALLEAHEPPPAALTPAEAAQEARKAIERDKTLSKPTRDALTALVDVLVPPE